MYTGSMKLTKFEHACVVLEQDHTSLVIDPGNFTTDFRVPENVAGVVITHVHPDHYDESKLGMILERNPAATVYALDEIAVSSSFPIIAISPSQTLTIGEFVLEFIGGAHATIHADMPAVGNVGVVVNHDLFYYPGDSFVQPPRHMRWIATPVAAPWLKLSESVEFLRAARPDHAFPTHDAILSASGLSLVDRVLSGLIDPATQYERIGHGETIEL